MDIRIESDALGSGDMSRSCSEISRLRFVFPDF